MSTNEDGAKFRLQIAPGRLTPEQAEEHARCPDCDSIVTAEEVEPNIFRVNVSHDDTCPTWRAMT